MRAEKTLLMFYADKRKYTVVPTFLNFILLLIHCLL